MHAYVTELFNADRFMMRFIYGIDLLSNFACVFVLLRDRVIPYGNPFFTFVFYFSAGGKTILDLFLFKSSFGSWQYTRHHRNLALLLSFVGMQAITVASDIAFGVIYGNFWRDGCFYALLETLLALSYLRRFVHHKKYEQLIYRETECAIEEGRV